MPALFIFLLKVNAALVVFCLGYYLVLRPLTFYTLNRIYLVTAIIFSTLYPFINLSAFAVSHQQIAAPVQQVLLKWEAPAEQIMHPLSQPDYWQWAIVIFWTGVIFMALKLITQLYSLYLLYRSSTETELHNYKIRVVNNDTGPFSFLRSIYINPLKHEASQLESILMHEQIHINEWHSLDILLGEVSTIFYWFNPGVWLMKKAIRENIEFITDRKILKNGIDTKHYQYSLVNVSLAVTPNSIVNHFNISTIKKRIIMMNTKKSSKFNLVRYAFLMSLIVSLLLAFSISKAELSKFTAKKLPLRLITQVLPKVVIGNNEETVLNQPVKKVKNSSINKPATTDTTKEDKHKVIVLDTDKKAAYFIKSINQSDKDFYFIDGKNGSLNNIDPNQIQQINVVRYSKAITMLSDENTRLLNPSLQGVVLIVLKGNYDKQTIRELLAKPNNNKSASGYDKVVIRGYANDARTDDTKATYVINGLAKTKSDSTSGTNLNFSSLSGKLIIIDGKEATEDEFKKLSVNEIKNININKQSDDLITQYGEKAKNGVIIITTKKNQ